MKVSLAIIFLSFLGACGNSSSENYNENRELIPNPEGYKKDSFSINTSKNKSQNDSVSHVNEKYAE